MKMSVKDPKPMPGDPAPTYDWMCADRQCNKLDCFKDPLSYQCVGRLWEATQATEFHDAELVRATKQINAILSRIERSNRDPKRTLSLIKFQKQHLLVWATYGVIGPTDAEKTIIKALKLKVPARKRVK
jgi:hypothetical protein